MSEILHVSDISLSFGGLKAVQNFSLSLPEGALYGLIGPNGAGKRPSSTCSPVSTSPTRAPSP
jgi:ABC-type branched-subunit amino acid transport system ATPase component